MIRSVKKTFFFFLIFLIFSLSLSFSSPLSLIDQTLIIIIIKKKE